MIREDHEAEPPAEIKSPKEVPSKEPAKAPAAKPGDKSGKGSIAKQPEPKKSEAKLESKKTMVIEEKNNVHISDIIEVHQYPDGKRDCYLNVEAFTVFFCDMKGKPEVLLALVEDIVNLIKVFSGSGNDYREGFKENIDKLIQDAKNVLLEEPNFIIDFLESEPGQRAL